jgi:hypothetical protein
MTLTGDSTAMTPYVFARARLRGTSTPLLLRRLDRPAEERDLGQAITDAGAQLAIMRGDFQRQVDQRATALLWIAQ